MKRVKPGRAPSAMGVAMCVIVAVFGVFWTIMAVSVRAPFFFVLFGVIFVVADVVLGVYNFKNATGKERFSVMDIVDDDEEGDPTDAWVQEGADRVEETVDTNAEANEDIGIAGSEINFCPYCGAKAEKAFRFCQKCGKRIR